MVIVAATRHGHLWVTLQVCYPPCVENSVIGSLGLKKETAANVTMAPPEKLIYLTQEDGEKYGIAFTRINIPGYDRCPKGRRADGQAAMRQPPIAPPMIPRIRATMRFALKRIDCARTLTIERFHQSKAVETMRTLEAHMAELRQMRDTAMANGKLGAAVRAEFLRGRAMGFYSDKTEHVATNEFARVTNFIDEQTKALDLVPAPKVSTKLRLKH